MNFLSLEIVVSNFSSLITLLGIADFKILQKLPPMHPLPTSAAQNHRPLALPQSGGRPRFARASPNSDCPATTASACVDADRRTAASR